MSRLLLILALICAVVLTALGFGWVTVNNGAGEPLGWLGLTLALLIGAELVP